MKRGAWIAVALLGAGRVLAAQTCTASLSRGAGTCSVNVTATMTVNAVVQLSLSTTTTALTAPGSADYDAGFVANTGPSATVQCNVTCRLQISAATATWSAVATTSVTPRSKPCADLMWSTSAGGTFVGLTTTPATVQTIPATGGSAPVSIFYKTLYAWGLDTPAKYSLTVVFTLAAP